MRTPLLVVLTTLALFAGVVSSIDSGPRARAAGASPRPSPKLRPSVAWPPRAASPKTKRAPQHWSPPSPRPPHPSPKPPQPSQNHPHDHKKRSEEDQNVLGGGRGGGGILGVIVDASHDDQKDKDVEGRCPESLTACPVRGSLDTDAFECVDLLADLSSCGGCAVDDIVYDCAAIAHARSVECVAGRCEVRLCKEGYSIAPQYDACVPTHWATRDTAT